MRSARSRKLQGGKRVRFEMKKFIALFPFFVSFFLTLDPLYFHLYIRPSLFVVRGEHTDLVSVHYTAGSPGEVFWVVVEGAFGQRHGQVPRRLQGREEIRNGVSGETERPFAGRLLETDGSGTEVTLRDATGVHCDDRGLRSWRDTTAEGDTSTVAAPRLSKLSDFRPRCWEVSWGIPRAVSTRATVRT